MIVRLKTKHYKETLPYTAECTKAKKQNANVDKGE